MCDVKACTSWHPQSLGVCAWRCSYHWDSHSASVGKADLVALPVGNRVVFRQSTPCLIGWGFFFMLASRLVSLDTVWSSVSAQCLACCSETVHRREDHHCPCSMSDETPALCSPALPTGSGENCLVKERSCVCEALSANKSKITGPVKHAQK